MLAIEDSNGRNALGSRGSPARRIERAAFRGDDLPGATTALGLMLDQPAPPTAVAASTDVLTMKLLHEAHRRVILVPDELSIAGFDDISLPAYTVPALTTVRMPIRDMVAAAVGLVIGDGRSDVRERRRASLVQPSLVVRASTGPVRNRGPRD